MKHDSEIFSSYLHTATIDTAFQATGRCHKTVGGFVPPRKGVQILFHPLARRKGGVAIMTLSELLQFCLVLISLIDLIIRIVDRKK